MTIQPQQDPPKPRETQKTSKNVGANGLHDDVVNLKVDVATLKEQGRHFATKEDIAKLETQIAQARAENNENIAKLETKIAKLETQIAQARAENNENNAKLEARIAKLETKIAEARADSKENIAKLETQIAKLEAQIAKNQAENKQAMAAMDNKIEKARNDLLYAVNRATVRVIIVLVSMMVAFGGTLLTTLLVR